MEPKEDLIITQLRNADEYEIKHTTIERVSGAKLKEIMKQIDEGIKQLTQKTKEEPERFAKMLEENKKSLSLLEKRREKFARIVDKFPKEKEKSNSVTG